MSWKTDITKEKCLCGKGTITITTRSDDWGRTEDGSRHMDCPECSKKYTLHAFRTNHKGMSSTGYRWVEKGKYKKAMNMYKESFQKIESAFNLSKSRYLPKWIEVFKGKKKNEIWRQFKDKDQHFVTLQTFYKHINHLGVEKYLIYYFENQNENALEILKIKDDNIFGLNKESVLLEQHATKLLFSGAIG